MTGIAPPHGNSPFWRMSVFYGALFLLLGGYLQFFPVWLQGRGLSSEEIGLMQALPAVVRMIAPPIIAFGIDRLGERRRPLFWLALVSLALFAAKWPAEGFLVILCLTLARAAAQGTLVAVTEGYGMQVARQNGFDYGRTRLWGSVTFIVGGTLCGAAMAGAGTEAFLPYAIFTCALIALAALALPEVEGSGPRSERQRPALADARALLADRQFLLFLLGGGLIAASHSTYYAFGSIHFAALGYGPVAISLLWAIGVVAEIAFFLAPDRITMAFGSRLLLLTGAGAGVVRWSAMAADPGPLMLGLLQCLHAFTFAAMHVGAMQFLYRRVPHKVSATAQALWAACGGAILGAPALWASGALYDGWGGGTYLMMAAMCAVGGLLVWLLPRQRTVVAG